MFNNSTFRSRPAYPTKMADSDASSHTIQMPEYSRAEADNEPELDKISTTKSSNILSSKADDFSSPARKPEREKTFINDNMENSAVSLNVATSPVSTSTMKTTDTILPQRSSSTKSTNVFSARDMGVVSPVKEMVKNDKEEMVGKFFRFEFFNNFRLFILWFRVVITFLVLFMDS